jgi:hypothetical protein
MLRMSCSADNYFEWNGRLDPSLQTDGRFSATLQIHENILLLTLEALSSWCYQHWQH